MGLCIRIDEVASVLIVCIQDLERGLFVAFAKEVFPVLVLIAISLTFGIWINMSKEVFHVPAIAEVHRT